MTLHEFRTLLEISGLPVAEYSFNRPPPLPYLVYLTDERVRGSDDLCSIVEYGLSVELYSKGIDRKAEKKLEDMLQIRGMEYTKNRIWVDSEKFFLTRYNFNFTTKL